MSHSHPNAEIADGSLIEALAGLSARDSRVVVNIIRRIAAIERQHGEAVADAAFERVIGMIRRRRRPTLM